MNPQTYVWRAATSNCRNVLHQSPDGPANLLPLTFGQLFVSRLRSAKTGAMAATHGNEEESMDLLWTLVVFLLVLWLLGLATSYTVGGFIHILLVVAIVIVLIRLIQGRRPVP